MRQHSAMSALSSAYALSGVSSKVLNWTRLENLRAGFFWFRFLCLYERSLLLHTAKLRFGCSFATRLQAKPLIIKVKFSLNERQRTNNSIATSALRSRLKDYRDDGALH
ncbi:hypothetical protein CXF74_03850 [Psychromonas sp. Urea-02u-13]|nr:hypothetical protein CXF74_03850 [Psychromonas sp. Urea-02u-13]